MTKHKFDLMKLSLSIVPFLLLLCSSFQSYSQEESVQSFGVKVNPLWTSFESQHEESYNELNFSMGIAYSRKIGPKWKLITGLNYTKLNFNGIKDFSPLWGCDHNGNGGVDIFNSWRQIRMESTFLGIPLELNFSPLKNRSIFISGGAEYMVNIINQGSIIHFVCGEEDLDPSGAEAVANNNLIKVKLGIGYEILLGANFTLAIEPHVEYYLTDAFSDVNEFKNSISAIGLSIRLMMND